MTGQAISIIIPAHNEEAVIARLLGSLSDHRADDEIIVVCDGCSDRTAEIARSFAGVTVVEQARGGKPSALNSGDRRATLFPRFFVDADIVVSASALYEVASLMIDGVEAGAPRCEVDISNSSWLVRRFYDVWTRLAYFNDHLMGSGVIGVTRRGRGRFAELPDVINDDGYLCRLFTPEERVGRTASSFLVTAPANLAALARIKTRVRLGNMQLDALQGPPPASGAAKGPLPASAAAKGPLPASAPAKGPPPASGAAKGPLPASAPATRRSAWKKLLISPSAWPAIVVFVAVRAVVEARARRLFRRAEFDGWARDESSRVLTGPRQTGPRQTAPRQTDPRKTGPGRPAY